MFSHFSWDKCNFWTAEETAKFTSKIISAVQAARIFHVLQVSSKMATKNTVVEKLLAKWTGSLQWEPSKCSSQMSGLLLRFCLMLWLSFIMMCCFCSVFNWLYFFTFASLSAEWEIQTSVCITAFVFRCLDTIL